MKETEIAALTFIGKPFLQINPQDGNAYYSAYQELESEPNFVELDKINKLERNRASLVIFGPEAFMYWQGMIFSGEADVNRGIMKYQLPAATVIQAEKDGNESLFALPLSAAIPTLLADVKKEGFDIPANLGLSEKPYILNVLYIDQQKYITSVYESAATEDVND